MNGKNFLFFCIKAALLSIAIAAGLWFFAFQIRDYQEKYEPRTSLLRAVNIREYSYALLGDSAFCSYYVSNDKDSIWMRFKTLTGKNCFPGAVNAGKHVDLIAAAKRMAHIMPTHSTVFIDILTPLLIIHDKSEKGNYESLIADVWRQEKFVIWKYFRYLNLNYLAYFKRSRSGVKTDRAPDIEHDRAWNIDGDFAKERYNNYVKQLNEKAAGKSNLILSENGKAFLDEIIDIFRKAKINVVFILMPLNRTQIYTYSDKKQADQIYFKLRDINETLKKHLDEVNVPYVDLFEAVPSGCFADLVHTNTCGDEIIAKSLANYVSNHLSPKK